MAKAGLVAELRRRAEGEFAVHKARVKACSSLRQEQRKLLFEWARKAGADWKEITRLGAKENRAAHEALGRVHKGHVALAPKIAKAHRDIAQRLKALHEESSASADPGAFALLFPPDSIRTEHLALELGGAYEARRDRFDVPRSKAFPFVESHGDGLGLFVGTTVHLWTTWSFTWTPPFQGFMKLSAPYFANGRRYNYANDGCFSSKDVYSRATLALQAGQDQLGGGHIDFPAVFHDVVPTISSQNIASSTMVDVNGLVGYEQFPVWGGIPVVITVVLDLVTAAEGDGSVARWDFESHGDYQFWIPFVLGTLTRAPR